MRQYFESDTRFYLAVGALTVAIFAVGIAVLALRDPDTIGTRELVGFVVGFLLFMLVYFVSLAVYRLEESEGVH